MRTMIVGVCSLFLMGASISAAQVVHGKPAASGAAKSSVVESMRLEPEAIGSTIVLLPRPASARTVDAAEAGGEKRTRIGSRRDAAMEKASYEGPATMQWIAAAGGYAARLALRSPQAAALRLALSLRDLPPGTELRFAGSAGRRDAGMFVPGAAALSQARAHGVYWTPVTEGDTQTVEVWVPARSDIARVRIAIDGASHLDTPPGMLQKAGGIGASESCNQDVVCAAPGNQAVANAARSVTKMVFTENGATYLCSATLISDGKEASQVPYLYTASHCIASQAAAATLNTYWFFDAPSCGARSSSYRQLSGGAKLLYSNPASDAALLRLDESAPDGAWFSGWDASPLPTGAALLALHHPAGDLKKLTVGQALAATSNSAGASYTTAAWLAGSTEGGSSGSGLFTLAGNEYVLRGGLRGGSASCASSGRTADPANRDYYSRIDGEAAVLRAWLDAAATPDEDYSGMWHDPSERGWGISIMQGSTNRVFVAWYTYDASGPTWLVMPDAEWSSPTSLRGKIYRASGTAFDRSYDPAKFGLSEMGSMRIDFGSADLALLSVELGGTRLAKALQRLPI